MSKLTRKDMVDFTRNLPTVRRQVKEIRRSQRSNQAEWVQRSSKLRSQDASAESTFGAAEELHNLASADRFLDWTHDEVAPYLGDRVVEVGAGLGSMTRRLAGGGLPREVVALEPAANLFDDLVERTADLTNVVALQQTSQQLLAGGAGGTFDAAVYVSVLEHILDDGAELQTAHELLAPGGVLAIFVPAMAALYGSLDFKSGHFRRYDKALLRSVVEQAGFDIVRLHYLEVAGVVPYWVAVPPARPGVAGQRFVEAVRLADRPGEQDHPARGAQPAPRQEPHRHRPQARLRSSAYRRFPAQAVSCGVTSTAGDVPTRLATTMSLWSNSTWNGPPAAVMSVNSCCCPAPTALRSTTM